MKCNMNMVNLALLVIILILVIYCLVNNKENFEGESGYPWTQAATLLKDVTPLSRGDIITREKRNENDKVILDDNGVPVTEMATRGDFVKTNAVAITHKSDGVDRGKPVYDYKLKRWAIKGPADGISDDIQLTELRQRNLNSSHVEYNEEESYGDSSYNNGSTPNSGETPYKIYENVKCLIDARESTSEQDFINKLNQC